METKAFPLRTILTVTTGRLLTKRKDPNDNGIGDLYEFLEWMCGEPPFTHTLGRFSKECKPYLFRWFPELTEPETDVNLARLDALLYDAQNRKEPPRSGRGTSRDDAERQNHCHPKSSERVSIWAGGSKVTPRLHHDRHCAQRDNPRQYPHSNIGPAKRSSHHDSFRFQFAIDGGHINSPLGGLVIRRAASAKILSAAPASLHVDFIGSPSSGVFPAFVSASAIILI